MFKECLRDLWRLYVCQSPRPEEDLQVDKDISLKVGGVVSSGLSWGSLEAVFLGEGVNDS